MDDGDVDRSGIKELRLTEPKKQISKFDEICPRSHLSSDLRLG